MARQSGERERSLLAGGGLAMNRHVDKGTTTVVSNDILSRLEWWYRVVREGLRVSAEMREHAPKCRREG